MFVIVMIRRILLILVVDEAERLIAAPVGDVLDDSN